MGREMRHLPFRFRRPDRHRREVHDMRALQDAILSGEHRGESSESRRKTVTVTLPSGQIVEGSSTRSMTSSSPSSMPMVTITAILVMGIPKVVVNDPLQPHLDMLRSLKDDDIHNLTAYLVTLK